MRAEVRARTHEPVEITEHFKPGNEEIAAILPPWARWLLAWGERTVGSASSTSPCMCAPRRLRLCAPALAREPALVAAEHLALRRGAGRDRPLAGADPRRRPLNVDLAREIAECARLIKGYGDTYKRGLANYRRITDEVIAPALARRMPPRAAADAVANARVAALADPEGETLSRTLAAIAAAAPPLRHAAE